MTRFVFHLVGGENGNELNNYEQFPCISKHVGSFLFELWAYKKQSYAIFTKKGQKLKFPKSVAIMYYHNAMWWILF